MLCPHARYIKAVHPDWDIKKDMFGLGYDKCDNCTRGFTTENAIMRLVFHDCVRYTYGTGGCDGCLNWGGVGDPHPNPNDVNMSVCQPKNIKIECFSTNAQYFQTLGSVIIFCTGR